MSDINPNHNDLTGLMAGSLSSLTAGSTANHGLCAANGSSCITTDYLNTHLRVDPSQLAFPKGGPKIVTCNDHGEYEEKEIADILDEFDTCDPFGSSADIEYNSPFAHYEIFYGNMDINKIYMKVSYKVTSGHGLILPKGIRKTTIKSYKTNDLSSILSICQVALSEKVYTTLIKSLFNKI